MTNLIIRKANRQMGNYPRVSNVEFDEEMMLAFEINIKKNNPIIININTLL